MGYQAYNEVLYNMKQLGGYLGKYIYGLFYFCDYVLLIDKQHQRCIKLWLPGFNPISGRIKYANMIYASLLLFRSLLLVFTYCACSF